MSIEEQISKITKLDSINDWSWHNSPLSQLPELARSTATGLTWHWPALRAWDDVDLLILEWPAEDCLRSKSEYIRECKKWFLSQSLEDNIKFIMRDIFLLENYSWSTEPNSLRLSEDTLYDNFRKLSSELYNDQSFSNNMDRLSAKRNYRRILLIDRVILNASNSLALISSSGYVRQCKKWFIDHERDILSDVIYYNKYRNINLD